MGCPFCFGDTLKDSEIQEMDTPVGKFVTLVFPAEVDGRKSIFERLVLREEFEGHLATSHLGMCHAEFPLGKSVEVTQYSPEDWDVMYAISKGELDLLAQEERIIELFKRYFREARCLLVREKLFKACNSIAQQVDDLLTGKIKLMCCGTDDVYRDVKSSVSDIPDVIPFQSLMLNGSIAVIWVDHGIPVWIPHSHQNNYDLLDVESLLASRAAVSASVASRRTLYPSCDIERTRLYAKYSSAHRMALKEWESRQFLECDDDVPGLICTHTNSDEHKIREPELSRSILNTAYDRGARPLIESACPRDQRCVRENPYITERCDCMDMVSPSYDIRPCRVDAGLEIEIKLNSLDELMYSRAVYEGISRGRNRRKGCLYPAGVIAIPLRPHSVEQYQSSIAIILEAPLKDYTALLSGAGSYETSTALYIGFVRT